MTDRDIFGCLYKDYIETNLKNIVSHSLFDIEFVTPEKLACMVDLPNKPYFFDENGKIKNENINLEGIEGLNKSRDLALDILENGFYYPLIVQKDELGYVGAEGRHRSLGILSLYNKGVWPRDKRIPVIVCYFDYQSLVKGVKDVRSGKKDCIIGEYPMNESLFLNASTLADLFSKKNYLINYDKKKLIDDELGIFQCEINDLYSFFILNGIYYGGISRDILKYKKRDNPIEPSRVINNIRDFYLFFKNGSG